MTHKRSPTAVVVLNMIYEFATEEDADRFMECVRHEDEKVCMSRVKPVNICTDEAQHPVMPRNDWV